MSSYWFWLGLYGLGMYLLGRTHKVEGANARLKLAMDILKQAEEKLKEAQKVRGQNDDVKF